MKLAVFCSNQCPGNLILAAYDWARAIREREDVTLIGGFHTPIEKDLLEILLRGTCPLVIVPARGLESMRLPAVWKPGLASGRIQLSSPFSSTTRRITRQNALKRNHFIADMADEILIIHASLGGTLEEQCRQWVQDGKTVTALPGEHNQNLWGIAVVPYNE